MTHGYLLSNHTNVIGFLKGCCNSQIRGFSHAKEGRNFYIVEMHQFIIFQATLITCSCLLSSLSNNLTCCIRKINIMSAVGRPNLKN